MWAVVWDGARRVEGHEVPVAGIEDPGDVVVRVTSSAICGTDPHMYDGHTGVVVSTHRFCGLCFNCLRGYTATCLRVRPGSLGPARRPMQLQARGERRVGQWCPLVEPWFPEDLGRLIAGAGKRRRAASNRQPKGQRAACGHHAGRHRQRGPDDAANADQDDAASFAPPSALLHSLLLRQPSETAGMRTRRPRPAPIARSAFAGFRFPADAIMLAVRWYLRFGLSYRDIEELLAERGIQVDHVTIYRWAVRFTPLLAEAARPCRHTVGTRWWVDETYVKVAGRWRYVYRAIDQFGQVIDVFVSSRRDTMAARRFFERAIGTTRVTPVEVVTDQAATYPTVLEELPPAAWHRTDQYANNQVECDHGRLKSRLRPMRGLKQDRNASVIIAGQAFVQNLRRGHCELAAEEPANRRVAVAFDELTMAI
jgi:transposase-like protein